MDYFPIGLKLSGEPVLIVGGSPVLARRIRSDIEARYPTGYSELSRYLGDRRGQVAEHLMTERERRYFWERLLDSSEFIDLVLANNREAADALFKEVLSEGKSPRGAVYLIGAGPGDPELLTFKALRLFSKPISCCTTGSLARVY